MSWKKINIFLICLLFCITGLFSQVAPGKFWIQFKDKNNNKFLQARTTFKNQVGKTKWVNAYVGTFKQYPKGVNDPEAIKKGQILIRQKIKGHFGIK